MKKIKNEFLFRSRKLQFFFFRFKAKKASNDQRRPKCRDPQSLLRFFENFRLEFQKEFSSSSQNFIIKKAITNSKL